MSVFYRGRKLTKEQLNLLVPLINEQLPDAQFRKRVPVVLKAAGLEVPPLEPGQKVTWSTKGVEDSGVIVSVDERAGKVRVKSKAKGRDFTVAERDICLEQ
ncbi:hypothetical protein uan_106 [Pseudomonas phage UAntarctica]|nr:hypothetical protein uan_106 [Pseudomonas phage UAntarctica]